MVSEGEEEPPVFDPVADWLYGTRTLADLPDYDQIERHAVAVLNRALTSGAMIGFIGAGVSMSYGRISWRDLVYAAQEEARGYGEKKSSPQIQSILKIIKDNIIDRGTVVRSDWLPYHFQLCERLVSTKHEPSIPPDQQLDLRRYVKRLVKDDIGHAWQILRDSTLRPEGPMPEWQSEALQGKELPPPQQKSTVRGVFSIDMLNEAIEILSGPSDVAAPPLLVTLLKGLTSRISSSHGAETQTDSQPITPTRRYIMGMALRLLDVENLDALIKRSENGPKAPPIVSRARRDYIRRDRDPLLLMLEDLRVRRFLTTNYDMEIERLLADEGFRVAGASLDETDKDEKNKSPVAPSGTSIDVNDQTTGHLIAFAVRNPRRSAHVAHLHGQALDDKKIIITEDDYQERYARNDESRPLIDDALATAFGGNPILFVGSGMGEDDILRPLRQFMGTPGWRGQRTGIALLPSLRSRKDVHQQKITLLARYGVYAIHFGSARKRKGKPALKEWLSEITEFRMLISSVLRSYKSIVHEVDQSSTGKCQKQTESPEIGRDFSAIINIFRRLHDYDLSVSNYGAWQLVSPDEIESIPVVERNEIDPKIEIDVLNAAFKFIEGIRDKVHQPLAGDCCSSIYRAAAAFEIGLAGTDDSLLSIMLCARLRRVRDDWDAWKKQWLQVPSYHEAANTPRREKLKFFVDGYPSPYEFVLEQRNSVILPKEPQEGQRFYSNASSQSYNVFDRALRDNAARVNHIFETDHPSRRRIFLIVAERGVGKGHFFSALQDHSEEGTLSRFATCLKQDPGFGRLWAATAFFNLSFSNEVASLYDRTADFIFSHAADISPETKANFVTKWNQLDHDRFGRLELVMNEWPLPPQGTATSKRLLLAFNGINILFDNQGRPKNAQIRRFFDALTAPSSRNAPMDIVFTTTATSIPLYFRRFDDDLDVSQSPSVHLDNARDNHHDRSSVPRVPLTYLAPSALNPRRLRLERSLVERLGLNVAMHDTATTRTDPEPTSFVHLLSNARASVVVGTFVPSVATIIALKVINDMVQPSLRNQALLNGIGIDCKNLYDHSATMSPAAAKDVRQSIRSVLPGRTDDSLWQDMFPRVFVAGALHLMASKGVNHPHQQYKDSERGIKTILDRLGKRNSEVLRVNPADGLTSDNKARLDRVNQALVETIFPPTSGSQEKIDLSIKINEFIEDAAIKFDDQMGKLYFLVDQSRFVLTALMVAAYEHLTPSYDGDASSDPVSYQRNVDSALRFLQEVELAVMGSTTSRQERVLAYVLETYRRRHSQKILPRGKNAGDGRASKIWQQRVHDATLFELQQVILWHLAAMGEPVEAEVLLRCPVVHDLLKKVKATPPSLAELDSDSPECLLDDVLWLLESRCLVFKVLGARWRKNRERPKSDDEYHHDEYDAPARYTLHGLLQRHLFRRIGAPLVEYTDIDPFSVTLYASQPSQLPRITYDTHQQLRETVAALSGYPELPELMHYWAKAENSPKTRRRMLRAAFGIMRSIYSVAGLARVDFISDPGTGTLLALPDHDHGIFEENRRQVYWLIGRATEFSESSRSSGNDSMTEDMLPFRAEELVWLYNECAVHSVAQGRLLDATPMFALARDAAGKIEPGETGPLRARIRLNQAAADIEGGRGAASKSILERIASPGGLDHPVVPLIARGHLAQLAHLRGEYRTADQDYREVVEALRKEGQFRAASIFGRQHADLTRVYLGAGEAALTLVNEAIQLAIDGGHEDIRQHALLSKIKVDANDPKSDLVTLHRDLDAVEKYARVIGMPRLTCNALEIRAGLHQRAGDMRTAGTFAALGLQVATRHGLMIRKVNLLLLLSEINFQRNQEGAAKPLLEEADILARDAECHYIRPRISDLKSKIY